MIKRGNLKVAAVAGCFLLLWVAAVASGQIELQGAGKSGKPFKKLIHLEAGTVEPNAKGIAKIMSKNKGKPKQTFQVVGANLKASATYRLFVNGSEIDSQTAEAEQGESGAAVEFHYSSRATANNQEGLKPLPSALDPVTKIQMVEIKDASGAVVLSGEFPPSP
jgi:hypothetical protein